MRKIAQYFYPQRQTKVMNEGWACFWHYTLMNDLYDRGFVNEQFMLEFLQTHTNVVFQPGFDEPGYSGINPYTLGYKMFMDIKRICQNPTKEDYQWFPEIAGKDWLQSLDFAMRNFKDESFIAQYLSPHLIRDLKLFSILDDDKESEYEITAIHNEDGYKYIRELLSNQFNLGYNEPNIQVYNVDTRGDRSLTLRFIEHDRRKLHEDTKEVMKHLHYLWGFKVKLEMELQDGNVKLIEECPS